MSAPHKHQAPLGRPRPGDRIWALVRRVLFVPRERYLTQFGLSLLIAVVAAGLLLPSILIGYLVGVIIACPAGQGIGSACTSNRVATGVTLIIFGAVIVLLAGIDICAALRAVILLPLCLFGRWFPPRRIVAVTVCFLVVVVAWAVLAHI